MSERQQAAVHLSARENSAAKMFSTKRPCPKTSSLCISADGGGGISKTRRDCKIRRHLGAVCGSRVCGSRVCGSPVLWLRVCGSQVCGSRVCGSRVFGSQTCQSVQNQEPTSSILGWRRELEVPYRTALWARGAGGENNVWPRASASSSASSSSSSLCGGLSPRNSTLGEYDSCFKLAETPSDKGGGKEDAQFSPAAAAAPKENMKSC
ncbi:unnamed protein product [Merluccius merluccius]